MPQPMDKSGTEKNKVIPNLLTLHCALYMGNRFQWLLSGRETDREYDISMARMQVHYRDSICYLYPGICFDWCFQCTHDCMLTEILETCML